MSHDHRSTDHPSGRLTTEPRDVSPAPQREQKIELSIPRVLAGALAAASAAVAASWLGIAGTVTGAVIASVMVSVGTALYAHPLERSSQRLRELPVLPERYRGAEEPEVAETMALASIDPPEPARVRRNDTTAAKRERPRRRVHWGAVAASSVVTLVAGFGILTGAEALLGTSISSLTGGSGSNGGTTFTRIIDHAPAANPDTNNGPGSTDPGSVGGGESASPVGPTSTPSTQAPSTGAPTTSAPSTEAPTSSEPAPSAHSGSQSGGETAPPAGTNTGGAAAGASTATP